MGFWNSGIFAPEARESLAAISLSLLCLAVSVRVVFLLKSREPEASPKRRKRFPGPATRVVIVAALGGGLLLTAFPDHLPAVPEAWQSRGLFRPPPESLPEGPVRPASREARVVGLKTLAKAVKTAMARQATPSSRDDIIGVAPELWCIPGQGGPAWLYLSPDENAGSWLLAEPFVIDGEQWVWSEARGIHEISAEECDAIALQLRSVR